ncbi:RDD family protein [Verrucosispora sp. WMMC514]|uniref:RDD family protein n=1 Tax=Verrucosispora sp. WMMC514 TaxID=3015156 RepID=UPI00248BBEAA|nr:RDD family protein [Verrucosispora sp. WMMC514]WBB93038.1 RDD family protein [Verrucosispora sp. WMMC514]
MTQPPAHPTPPAGGPPAGGVAPSTNPPPVPAQWTPLTQPPPGQPGPQGYAPQPPWVAGPPPPGWAAGPPPPVLGPGGQPLANFGDRLLAYLIDTAIATGVLIVFFVPVFVIIWLGLVATVSQTNPDGTLVEPDSVTVFTNLVLPMLLLQAGLFVLMLAIYWLYHVEYLKRTGQTVGKKVMKLRVVSLDPTRTLDRRMAGKRYLVQFVGGSLVPGGSYVDGLWQLWDKPWQQCLHDKFAGTVVVKVSR